MYVYMLSYIYMYNSPSDGEDAHPDKILQQRGRPDTISWRTVAFVNLDFDFNSNC